VSSSNRPWSPANWAKVAPRLGEAVPADLGLLLTAFSTHQLSPEAKARIVFVRARSAASSEAFTKHAQNDPRVDLAALKAAYGPPAGTARERNALWHRLYNFVGDASGALALNRAALV
jgi:hypothetical protein